MVSPTVLTGKPRQAFKCQHLQKTSVFVGGNIIIWRDTPLKKPKMKHQLVSYEGIKCF